MARSSTSFGSPNQNQPGRPRATDEEREAERLLRELSPAAVDRLRELMASEDENVSLKASLGVLGMTVGKLTRTKDVTERNFGELTPEQRDNLRKRALALVG